jgi:predicted aldo/keto reductase-like oxidoreductase
MQHTTLGRTGLEHMHGQPPPSACTECGACTPRCPFGVDVETRMREAVASFESASGPGTF